MQRSVTVIGSFCAAHCLHRYVGKCSQLHGHTWRVEVTWRGDQLQQEGPCTGMLCDFALLKQVLERCLVQLDHKLLNDVPRLGGELTPPTAELLAQWIWDEVGAQTGSAHSTDNVKLACVRIWETDRTYAELRA